AAACQVPRTRSSRTSRGKFDRELRVQRGTRIIELLVVRKLSLRLWGGRCPTRHDQLRQQDLDGLAALVAGFAAHSRHPAIGPRAGRHDLLDFAYDLEGIARPRRLRPTDL